METKRIKYTSKLLAQSIEKSGLPSDYKKAIAEYIWNGFDAGANTININYSYNSIHTLDYLSIEDNGSGINMETLNETFGNFNFSQKALSFSEIYNKGRKGKGRFSFINFCNNAVWNTIYTTNDNKSLKYDIFINRETCQDFYTDNNQIVKNPHTGTTVFFSDFHYLTGDLLDNDDFFEFLSSEFGWFLYLNRDNDFKIYINGKELDYNSVIEDTDTLEETIDDYSFKISFIRWKSKISEKYYYYFLNDSKIPVGRKHTSFNNKTQNFHHSVYVESEYFNSFLITKEEHQTLDFYKNQEDFIFKKLERLLYSLVSGKEKSFIRECQAEKLIKDYQKKDIFPKFKNNEYDKLREDDLKRVVKELYSVQPKIFQNLKIPQSKALVGFLNLLLDSEQREHILNILENIVDLSDKEREELAGVLKNTKIAHIIELVNFLENRFKVVETLKTLIYDLEKFTNERDHIQKIIENNYWLFGEQYHLVSADKNFETTLQNYLYYVEENLDFKVFKEDSKLKRPDIFIAKKFDIPSHSDNDSMIEENIMVELKRPNVPIGKKQFSQIEDYMNIIMKTPKFNSKLRTWKFYIIGKEVDDYIEGLYDNQSNKGKKFLIQQVKNYEIYALTWDDLFRIFDNRHKNFIDKLEFKDTIIEKLNLKNIPMNREASDNLTKTLLQK